MASPVSGLDYLAMKSLKPAISGSSLLSEELKHEQQLPLWLRQCHAEALA